MMRTEKYKITLMKHNLYNIVFMYRFNFEYETKQLTFVDFLNEQSLVLSSCSFIVCTLNLDNNKTCQMHLLIFFKEKFQVL